MTWCLKKDDVLNQKLWLLSQHLDFLISHFVFLNLSVSRRLFPSVFSSRHRKERAHEAGAARDWLTHGDWTGGKQRGTSAHRPARVPALSAGTRTCVWSRLALAPEVQHTELRSTPGVRMVRAGGTPTHTHKLNCSFSYKNLLNETPPEQNKKIESQREVLSGEQNKGLDCFFGALN